MQNPEYKESQYKPGDEVPIRIGELVYPFSHPACENAYGSNLETKFCLGISLRGKNIKLRINTNIHDCETNGLQLTPLEPERGYIITSDDLNLEKRRKKLLEAVRRAEGFGIYPEFPLAFGVEINSDYFVQDGLAVFQEEPVTTYGQKCIAYNPDSLLLLYALRCRVIIGDMAFESKLIPTPQDLPNEIYPKIDAMLGDHYIYCGDFYPLDTGPLASDSHGTYSQEDDGSDLEIGPGHELFFANDPKQIAKMGVEFIIASIQLFDDDFVEEK